MDFDKNNRKVIARMTDDTKLQEITNEWFIKASEYEYSYHFKWMGRPIIQFPQDIIATQEIIWETKPDLIIETGIARGGSLIFSASMLELLGNNGHVIGIDIDIREHNRIEIEKHPMYKNITMIEGSSISPETITQVRELCKGRKKIMVCLDSMHTHEHVLKELELYSEFVSQDCYLIAFDTVVEKMPKDFYHNRPWGIGDNPMTAVEEFLKTNDNYVIEKDIENKLLITVAPSGYLKRIR